MFLKPYARKSCLAYLLSSLITISNLAIINSVMGSAAAQTDSRCQIDDLEIFDKNRWRNAAQNNNPSASIEYEKILVRHRKYLEECRRNHHFQTQALWLRLYPCDANPGALAETFDKLVNKGYNEVYLATFYTGRVLLPKNENPTAWRSVLNQFGYDNRDLLAEAIQEGRKRGLKVYAWMYSLSFGADYGLTPQGESGLGVNGRGEKTWFSGDEGYQSADGSIGPNSTLFVDPHGTQVRNDYQKLVQEVVKRRPDGILFDYIRYPRGRGAQSVATGPRDLWIYGADSRRLLESLAQNGKGQELIRRYLNLGSIRAIDLQEVDEIFPEETAPMWKGRQPRPDEMSLTPAQRLAILQGELWELVVNHAYQGVVEFLNGAIEPAQLLGVRSGAVFFPEGNQVVGSRGRDSRMQPWDKFPPNIQWHPMVYAICGQSNCIEAQVQRVVQTAPLGTQVIPALAGVWGRSLENRPSLEDQMDGIRRTSPQVRAISHFAYSWQEPESDYYRSRCILR
jgi:hypothetical protein